MPDQVDQVGGIVAIVDGEGGIEPDLIRIVAQQPRADAVEGAGPLQRVGHDAGLVAQHLSGDALDAPAHLGGGAPRKRHQQDAPGIGAVDDQMGDPVRQRVGLAGSGAGDHQQRRSRPAVMRGHDAVLDGPALLWIEAFEVARRRWHVRIVLPDDSTVTDSRFVRNGAQGFASPGNPGAQGSSRRSNRMAAPSRSPSPNRTSEFRDSDRCNADALFLPPPI